jgi:hypothetical protein
VISLVHVQHLIGLGEEKIGFPIGIEGLKVRVFNNWAVLIEAVVPPEAIEVAVVIIHGIGEDLC